MSAPPKPPTAGPLTMLVLSGQCLGSTAILLFLWAGYALDRARGLEPYESGVAFFIVPTYFLLTPQLLVLLGMVIWGIITFIQVRRGRRTMTSLLRIAWIVQIATVVLMTALYSWFFFGFVS